MTKKEVADEKVKNRKSRIPEFLSKLKKEIIIIGVLIATIIIGGALCFRTITAKNKIISIAQEKKQIIEDEISRLAAIENGMKEIITEEANYLQIISGTATEENIENAAILYKTKTSSLIDKIAKKITPEDYTKFDPNLLMNYARHLDMKGDTGNAKKVFEYVIEKTKDSTTLSNAYRSLANIHAINTSPHFSQRMTRKYRAKDIAIAKAAPQNDLRYLKLIDLYEIWALDEYTNLKNVSNGNKLLDTAIYCIGRLSDYSPLKAETEKRIRATYNFYNDVLIPENTTGKYKYYINNQGVGDAIITINDSLNSIQVDYTTEGKLVGQLKGTGGFVDYNLLKFEVEIESYSDVFKTQKKSSGNIELEAKKGKLLDGTLNEYGEKPVGVKLVKQ